MVQYTERMLVSWKDGQTRDVQADMMRLTLEIVARTLFAAEIGSDTAGASAAMETLMHTSMKRMGRLIPVPAWLPTPSNLIVERAARRLDEIILTIIAQRRRSGEDRGDLLSMLLHAQDEESGRRMTDQQLRDEAMTLFMAGHETTANTLAWVWFLLANHPESEAMLHAELDAVLGDRPPTIADLPQLKYTGLVVTEALRVYPTVWMVGRENIEPVELGGYTIPAGTTIFMPQWTIHRDPRWFDEPESFRPERWALGLQEQIHRYAYFPFGGGPRICIGNNFALDGIGPAAGDDRPAISPPAHPRRRRHTPSQHDPSPRSRGQGGRDAAAMSMLWLMADRAPNSPRGKVIRLIAVETSLVHGSKRNRALDVERRKHSLPTGPIPGTVESSAETLHREPRFKHSRQDTPRVAPKHSLVSNGRVWAGPPAGAGKAASELAISDPGFGPRGD